MSEQIAVEQPQDAREPINWNKLGRIGFAVVAISSVVALAAGLRENSNQSRATQARTWLASRGIPGCEGDDPATPCVHETIDNGFKAIVKTSDTPPGVSGLVVNCLFPDDPRMLEPGCYINIPDGFDEPYDDIITSPESVQG